MRPLPIARLAPLLVAAAFLLPGCSKDSPSAPVQAVAPTPDTPINAVRLLEWAWDHRVAADYAPILTADFAFVFSLDDAAGDHFPGRALTRDQELAAAGALFAGGVAGHPAASSVSFAPGAQLFDTPDPRPGKDPTWHRAVESRFDLTVVADTTTYFARGGASFYLVRGDSAMLPPGPLERVAAGDTARWFLERLEERPPVVISEGRAAPQPSRQVTWGYLKWFYLGSPAGPSAVSRRP